MFQGHMLALFRLHQIIPHPGSSFQSEGMPARQDHQYIRGNTCKLLTLFRPAIDELRAEPVDQSTNAILHPWLKQELESILKQCPHAPVEVPEGRRWQGCDPFPAAEQLDRLYPPLRMLLILDNLAGHHVAIWYSGVVNETLDSYTPLVEDTG